MTPAMTGPECSPTRIENRTGRRECNRPAASIMSSASLVAARMEAASQPNRVLTSAATAKALGDDFVLDGPQKIATKEERVLEAFFVDRRP